MLNRNMKFNYSQLCWWVIVCFQILILSLGAVTGIWTHIWEVDITRISFAIVGIWAVSTCILGWLHSSDSRRYSKKLSPVVWFLAESCLALGMIGTVAGFLFMLLSAFGNIDINDTASMQQALQQMALGMGTALYTTLTGLVCSLFIKAQLVNLEAAENQHG